MARMTTYQRRQTANQCTTCGGPRDTEVRQICTACALKMADRVREYTARRMKLKRCRNCSSLAEPNKTRCMRCIKKDTNRRKNRVAQAEKQHTCYFGCGQPRVDGRKTCVYHLTHQREYMREKRRTEDAKS